MVGSVVSRTAFVFQLLTLATLENMAASTSLSLHGRNTAASRHYGKNGSLQAFEMTDWTPS